MSEFQFETALSRIMEIQKKNRLAGGELMSTVSNCVYDLLTVRTWYFDEEASWRGPADMLARYADQARWYRAQSDAWEAVGEWNPGWIQLNCFVGEKPKEAKATIKAYRTIPVEQYSFIASLGPLRASLLELSAATGDAISFKFPRGLVGFLRHRDSLVVHFRQPSNAGRIGRVLDSWMEASGIRKEDREMGRAETAADHSGKSFTELIADQIAYGIASRPEKTRELLAEAVSIAQKVNFQSEA